MLFGVLVFREREAVGIVRTGMILKGRYCILEQIGAGGGGSVFLARDLELGSVWAVKEIPLSEKREAKLMRLLEHPALPRMVDYVEQREFCYLVMEYIRGKSLRECLNEQRDFSLERILNFGIVIAGVLEYLHNQEPPVFYGDLKPENLMLSEHGKLYLVDLGSAVKMYRDRNVKLEGTYGYAAPEQYEGQMKKSGDVYALGKTLWELMGRKRLWYFIKQPGMFLFLLRCCQKRADFRYPDMEAVKEELRKLRLAGRYGKRILFFPVFLAGILAAVLLYRFVEKPSFLKAMNEVTRQFYETDFLSEDSGKASGRSEICMLAEQQMQSFLKRYSETEEQKRLLLLLARNAEFAGKPEHAALYYEQLLLYQPEFLEGYGEYGCFLFRIGQQEESIRLWENYQKENEKGMPEAGRNGKLLLWEKEVKAYEAESQ